MQPTATQVSTQTVEQMLQQDLRTTEALSLLLQREFQVLQGRDSSELQSLLGKKQELMSKLEQSARQRSQWIKFIAARSEIPVEKCWDYLLQQLDSPSLITLWQQLQEKIQTCKSSNEVNGRAISRGQRTLRQLVGILRGQYVESPRLYTASGDTRTQNNSHTVIKV